MSRTKTNVRLEPLTIGYLHYLLDVGETSNIYSIIDNLVSAYIEHYAETTKIDKSIIDLASLELFKKTRRPQSKKSKEQQIIDIKKSVGKMKVSKKPVIDIVDEPIEVGSLEGNF